MREEINHKMQSHHSHQGNINNVLRDYINTFRGTKRIHILKKIQSLEKKNLCSHKKDITPSYQKDILKICIFYFSLQTYHHEFYNCE